MSREKEGELILTILAHSVLLPSFEVLIRIRIGIRIIYSCIWIKLPLHESHSRAERQARSNAWRISDWYRKLLATPCASHFSTSPGTRIFYIPVFIKRTFEEIWLVIKILVRLWFGVMRMWKKINFYFSIFLFFFFFFFPPARYSNKVLLLMVWEKEAATVIANLYPTSTLK